VPNLGKDMVWKCVIRKKHKTGDKVLKSSKIDLVLGDGKMSYEEEIRTDSTNPTEEMQMNNNVESVDLEELYNFKFEVPKGQANRQILDGFDSKCNRNKIQIAATEGNIFVNDATVKSNYKVKAFDVVRVMLTHPPLKIILCGEYSIGYCL
jgi:hypothetical protein